MRRILSVVLAVVMLAALATVFSVNAVPAAPDLVITEVMPDTTGLSANGSDTSDGFEFIELFNAGATPVNLYEYSMVIGTTVVGTDPTAQVIEKVNPIQQKGPGATNTAGTISTANYDTAAMDNFANYYPTNPDTAVLQPGQTAVIWFVLGDPVAQALYGQNRAATLDDFKKYARMDQYSEEALENILVLAVDANGSSPTTKPTTVYAPTTALKTSETGVTYYAPGVNANAVDANGFNGRFNLYNSNTKVYGIIKTANIAKDAVTGVPSSTIGECVSYAYANYATADATKNLAYKYNQMWGSTGTGSTADISYNFIYSDAASTYTNGKLAGNIKFADWDCMKFITPGLLLSSQVDNFTALGSSPVAELEYVQNRVPTNASSILYTVYQQNFYGMADSTDSDAILTALGWEKTYYLSNGGTIRYYIEGEKLIADNLDVDGDGDGLVDGGDAKGDIDSTDGLVKVYPSMKMEKIAKSDYTIEYEVTYLDAHENLRYCGVIFNFNEKTSYDIFILRVNGAGNNQRRIGGSTYTTYDKTGTVAFAGNADTVDGNTSIINKITNGEVSVKSTESTSMFTFTDAQKAEYAPLLGRTIKVRIEVNQVTGPEFYINDILVSKSATVLTVPNDETSAIAANPYWGAQTNYNEFTIGFFVSQRVKLAIDNIKVTGWVNEYTENDILRTYEMTELKEPATGDATIYVAVAMAVSFISLAALVVVKRRKNEN